MKRIFLNILFILFILNYKSIFDEPLYCQDDQIYKFNNLKENKSPKLQAINDPYWITYFGGADDDIFSNISLDKNNEIVAVGSTYSSLLKTSPNAFQKNNNGGNDIYVAKFDFKGNLLWSTYIGGNNWEYAYGMKIDKFNRIWIVGETRSSNFPINSLFARKGSGYDGIIICFDEDGKLVFSTQIGGNDYDSYLDLDFNDTYIYAVGRTLSYTYPVTSDAFQKNNLGGYKGILVRIDLNTFDILSSFVGTGTSDIFLESIALDQNNDIILGGFTNDSDFPLINNQLSTSFQGSYDIWLQKLNSNFNIIWSNLYGGSGTEKVTRIQVDEFNNIYCLGFTNSTNIKLESPLQQNLGGEYDGLLFKLDEAGRMIWSTYLGGPSNESYKFGMQTTDRFLAGLYIDKKNQRVAANFRSASSNMYTTINAFQPAYNGGQYDSYSIILNFDEEPYYATYFGGSGEEMSQSIFLQDSILIISGQTSSSNLPITSNAFQSKLNGKSDAFIAIFGIPLTAPRDSIPPTITSSVDSCEIIRTISVADNQLDLSGIKEINIIQSDNCDISITNKTQTTAVIIIHLIDTEQNGYYTIDVIDNAGNKTTLKDSLLASSHNYLSFTPTPLYDYGKINFGQKVCKNVTIHNKSANEISINEIYVAKNLDFSIPQSQFPLLVPANDSINLEVCFMARFPLYGIYRDTLLYFSECVYARTALAAEIDTSSYYSTSRCDVIIDITSNYDSLSYPEPLIYPNPNRGMVWIDSDYKKGDITLEVYNILGEQVSQIQIKTASLPFQIDLSNLENGNYILLIRQNNTLSIKKITLIK